MSFSTWLRIAGTISYSAMHHLVGDMTEMNGLSKTGFGIEHQEAQRKHYIETSSSESNRSLQRHFKHITLQLSMMTGAF